MGGTNCTLCGAPNTNKSTCPLNPKATNPNPKKHPNAIQMMQNQTSNVQQKVSKQQKSKSPINVQPKVMKSLKASYDVKTYKDLARKLDNVIRKPNSWLNQKIPCKDLLTSLITDEVRNEVPLYELLIDALNTFPDTLPLIKEIVYTKAKDDELERDPYELLDDEEEVTIDNSDVLTEILKDMGRALGINFYNPADLPLLEDYVLTMKDIKNYEDGTLETRLLVSDGGYFGRPKGTDFPFTPGDMLPNGQIAAINKRGKKSLIFREGMIEYLKDLLRRIEYEQVGGGDDFADEIAKLCDMMNSVLPSENWIKSQKKYLETLPPKDKKFVKLYTKYGDAFINTYIRNGYKINESDVKALKKTPFIIEQLKTEEELNAYAKEFYDSLQKTIMNAPKLDKDILVWRGIKSNKHLVDLKENENYEINGIMSTSLKPGIAQNFSLLPKTSGYDVMVTKFPNAYNYINKIIIPKGSSILLIAPESEFVGEREILLPDKTMFKINEGFKRIPHLVDSNLVSPGYRQIIGAPTILTNEMIIIN